MSISDVETQAKNIEVGAAEGSGLPNAHDRTGDSPFASESGTVGSDSPGLSGDDSAIVRCTIVLGKVVARLIKNAEIRLGEMRECVEWYQREVEKVEAELIELREIAADSVIDEPDIEG